MIRPIAQFEGLNVTFNTGEACNLACTYCYEVNKKNTVLDLEYAKKFIDILLSDEDIVAVEDTEYCWIMKKGIVLDFIGGDALMFPDLVEQIILYFIKRTHQLNHRWKDNWRVSISTNGTLFSNPRVRKLIERWRKVMSISVSIDGCPEIHDKNRIYLDGRGSMADIVKNLPWFRGVLPEASITTKATMNKDSIPYLYKSLVYMYEELGLRQINQNFIFEDMNLSKEDLEELDRQMKKCVDYVYERRDSLYWGMIDKRFYEATSFEDNCKAKPLTGWCGSGAMPALSVEGKIYPCFRFLPHTQDKGIDMSVGDIWNGITKKENFICIRSQTREKISPEKCRDCEIESSCAWCIAGAYSEKGEPFRQTYICDVQKIQAKWSKIYWERYYKENEE